MIATLNKEGLRNKNVFNLSTPTLSLMNIKALVGLEGKHATIYFNDSDWEPDKGIIIRMIEETNVLVLDRTQGRKTERCIIDVEQVMEVAVEGD